MEGRLTEVDVVRRIGAELTRAGSIRALAREWKISPSYLSDVLTGRRRPGPGILVPLDLVRVVEVFYVPLHAEGRLGHERCLEPPGDEGGL